MIPSLFLQDSSFYALLSKSTISEVVTTGQCVPLPYLPGFMYAAYGDGDAAQCQETTMTFFNSLPALLRDHIYCLDGFRGKVMRVIHVISL